MMNVGDNVDSMGVPVQNSSVNCDCSNSRDVEFSRD